MLSSVLLRNPCLRHTCTLILVLILPATVRGEVGKHLGTLDVTFPNSVQRLALSANGWMLAAVVHDAKTLRQHIRLYDVKTQKEVGRIELKHRLFWLLAFSPDGKNLCTSMELPGGGRTRGDTLLEFWDVGSRKSRRSLHLPSDTGGDGRFTPDSKMLVIFGRKHILLIDVAKGEEAARFPVLACSGWMTLSSDGKRIALSNGQSAEVNVYDLPSRKRLFSVKGDVNSRGAYAPALVFTPDGKGLVCMDDQAADVSVFNVPSGRKRSSVEVKQDVRHRGPVVWADKEHLVIPGGCRMGFSLLKPATGELIRPARWARTCETHCMAVSANGKKVAVAEKNEIELWELNLEKK